MKRDQGLYIPQERDSLRVVAAAIGGEGGEEHGGQVIAAGIPAGRDAAVTEQRLIERVEGGLPCAGGGCLEPRCV